MAPLSDLKPQHNVTIQTPRLCLRPVCIDDLLAVHQMRLNPSVMKYMPGVETELDPLKSFSVRRIELMMAENKFSFAVELSKSSDLVATASTDATTMKEPRTGTVVGFVGITRPPEIFYIFDEPYWGKGYATEALQAFMGVYWTRFPDGLPGVDRAIQHRLEAYVIDGNAGSERILAKLGFIHVGDAVTEAHGRDDVAEKIFRLTKLREEDVVRA